MSTSTKMHGTCLRGKDHLSEIRTSEKDGLVGAEAIAVGWREETGEDMSVDSAFYALATGQIPGFKLPGSRLWRSTRTLIRQRYRQAQEKYLAAAG